jgi:hypothetical protein
VPNDSGSGAGRWNDAYKKATRDAPEAYGDVTTYGKGFEYMSGLHIEDWGCGLGWMRKYVPPEHYVGVDGSNTPHADKVVDLCEYRSSVEGIFMRHVLEHNARWRDILRNAAASYTKRLVLVLFTPIQVETRRLTMYAFTPGVLIPDIGFAKEDILRELRPHVEREETLRTETHYGVEHIFYCQKR